MQSVILILLLATQLTKSVTLLKLPCYFNKKIAMNLVQCDREKHANFIASLLLK